MRGWWCLGNRGFSETVEEVTKTRQREIDDKNEGNVRS